MIRTKTNLTVKIRGDEGVIEAVVDTFGPHINNPDVCKQGCGALKNMIKNNGKNTGDKAYP